MSLAMARRGGVQLLVVAERDGLEDELAHVGNDDRIHAEVLALDFDEGDLLRLGLRFGEGSDARRSRLHRVELLMVSPERAHTPSSFQEGSMQHSCSCPQITS